MIVHLINGLAAAEQLQQAQGLEAALSGLVLALPDRLHHGPLFREIGQSFGQVRRAYWQQVRPLADGVIPEESLQEEALLEAVNMLQKFPQAQLWIWMAPNAADVVAYYHSLRYLAKHVGRVSVINIAGLPFLDEAGKVFFPTAFDFVPPKEFVKARRLARLLTPAEWELDGEIWNQISGKSSFYRFLQKGKTITTEEETYFDRDILQTLRTGPVKAARLAHQLVAKQTLPTDEAALLYRIQKLAAAGNLLLNGDVLKSPREWELSLPAPAGSVANLSASEESKTVE